MMKLIKTMFAVLALGFALNSHADLNDDDYMAFSSAVTEGKMDVVKKFVEADASILKEKFFAWEPIQMAASRGQVEVVKYLASKGADLDVAHPLEKTTAIHLAAYAGYKDVVKALVDAGADKNKKTKGGMSIAYLMRVEGNTEMADFLKGLGIVEDGCKKECF